MTSHSHRLALAALLLLALLPTQAHASAPTPARLISQTFNLQVVGQGGDGYYVSSEPDTVTLYDIAYPQTVALLAHNDRAGAEFYSLSAGDRLMLAYPDGRADRYRVAQIEQYQALGEGPLYGEYRSLTTGETLDGWAMIERLYLGNPGALVLQTCLARGSRGDWGLSFWIAWPDPEPTVINWIFVL